MLFRRHVDRKGTKDAEVRFQDLLLRAALWVLQSTSHPLGSSYAHDANTNGRCAPQPSPSGICL